MFNTVKFLEDYSIEIAPEGHHHVTEGNVSVHCPFCPGKDNFHLGISETDGVGNCWRCGGHSIMEVIKELARCDWRGAKTIKQKYSTGASVRSILKTKKKVEPAPDVLKLPYGSKSLKEMHLNYLRSRDFDPDYLIHEFKLLGTPLLGSYGSRIIAPIFSKGKMVSYQGRDITNKSIMWYKACAKKDELIHHKDTLYNVDNATGETVVVVEGITDVWRLGDHSMATFGISYTMKQVNILKDFKRVFIMFDDADTAQEKANSLANDLALFCDVEIVSCPAEDPAKMSQQEANKYMKELINWSK